MSENKEIRTYFGRCRCCLSYGYMKRMWSKHFIDDVIEIYGEMLIQCFGISFQFSESSMQEDQICEPCIMKLREAIKFKKTILDVQEELSKLKDKGEEYFVKLENPSDHCEARLTRRRKQEDRNEHSRWEKEDVDYIEFEEVEYLEEDHKPEVVRNTANGDKYIIKVENNSEQYGTGDPLLTPYRQTDPGEYSDTGKEDAQDIEFEEVEFLEEESKPVMEEISRRIISDFKSQQPKVKKKPAKKSKKLPNRLRYKTYKQYSAEDLTHCVEAIHTKRLSVQEAADMYNIPRKTIEAKVKAYNGVSEFPEIRMNSKFYKYCVVPQCQSTTVKTPNKLFIYGPRAKTMREKWLTLARRDPRAYSVNSRMYFCEDHFDLPNDMENYMEYHIKGFVSQIRLKPGCVPTKFDCLQDRRNKTIGGVNRSYILNKQHRMIIEECLRESARS